MRLDGTIWTLFRQKLSGLRQFRSWKKTTTSETFRYKLHTEIELICVKLTFKNLYLDLDSLVLFCGWLYVNQFSWTNLYAETSSQMSLHIKKLYTDSIRTKRNNFAEESCMTYCKFKNAFLCKHLKIGNTFLITDLYPAKWSSTQLVSFVLIRNGCIRLYKPLINEIILLQSY